MLRTRKPKTNWNLVIGLIFLLFGIFAFVLSAMQLMGMVQLRSGTAFGHPDSRFSVPVALGGVVFSGIGISILRRRPLD